ncbi:hypothetical protein SFUMM280S_05781 [Streptomyces fumanus]
MLLKTAGHGEVTREPASPGPAGRRHRGSEPARSLLAHLDGFGNVPCHPGLENRRGYRRGTGE